MFMVVVRYGGYGFTALVTWFIVTGHFVFIPSRVKISTRFYRALFPGRRWYHYLYMAWRQYHNFSRLYLDRFFFADRKDITYNIDGWDRLEGAVSDGTGGIILMSHIGYWETAARLLSGRGLPLMLFMGTRQRDQLEKHQKENLRERGLRIVAVDEEGENPFSIIDGLKFLKNGGLVSLTGDRCWKSADRTVQSNFLGHRVDLPEVPHMLALLSGAPLFIFFAFKPSRKRYRFIISEPIYVCSKSRADRKDALSRSAQAYADRLEEMVRERPLEWYHFEPFLGERL